MKTRWKTLAAALLTLAGVLTNAMSAPQAFAAIKKGGTLRLATEGQFPPFNYFDRGKLTGFEIDLADALAKDMGLKPEWKTYPFDSLLIGLNQNKYDMVIASHGITPERAKAVDFTDPHYCTGGIIVSKAGGPRTIADLKGKTVAVEVGTTYIAKLQQIKGIGQVKTYPKDTDSLQNLLAGHADAWVTDKFAALAAAKKQPGLQMGDMILTEKVGIAVAKGNPDLVQAINASLKHLEADGTYTKLSNKYFGQDIRCRQ